MSFGPVRAKAALSTGRELRRSAAMIVVGLFIALVIPAVAPQPQGSPFYIVVWALSWLCGFGLALFGLWHAGRTWWQARQRTDPPQ